MNCYHKSAVYVSIILLLSLHRASCYIANSDTNNNNNTTVQEQMRNANNSNKTGLPQLLRNRAMPLHKILYMSVNYVDKMLASLLDTNSSGSGGRQVIASRFTITLSTLVVITLVTILTLFGFGGIGFIAAKALFVGSLALFLTSIHGFKSHRKSDHDSGGHYVHYVPVSTGHHYQDTSSFSFQKDDEFASHYRG